MTPWMLPEAVMAAAFTVPLKVGLALKTRLPVPVVPVTDEAKLAAVMVLVKAPPVVVATKRSGVRPLKVIVPEEVRPVSDPSVPAMVELPVMVAPPEVTVRPVPAVTVVEALKLPVTELLPVIDAPPAETVRPPVVTVKPLEAVKVEDTDKVPVTELLPVMAAPPLVTVRPVPAVTEPEKDGLLLTAIVTVSVAPAVVEMLDPAAMVMVSPLVIVCGLPLVAPKVKLVIPEPEPPATSPVMRQRLAPES